MQQETCTKWHQEYEAGSGTKSGMEDQLQRLIKAITDSSTAATKPIHESNHEEFGVVRNRPDSIFDIISKQPSARNLLQDNASISTKPWSSNVQVTLTAIDVGNEEVHQ